MRARSAALIGALLLLGASASRAQGGTDVRYPLLYKPVCDQLIPGFAKATEANFAAWQKQNQEAIRAVESDLRFQAQRAEAMTVPPPEFAQAKARQIAPACERIAGIFEAAAPPDAHFAAPERTWESFRNALSNADRNMVALCLTGNARSTFGGQLHTLTDERLQRMGAAISTIKLAERHDNFQEAVITQQDG